MQNELEFPPTGISRFHSALIIPHSTFKSAAGRICTCINPLRRRMPHVFGHGSVEMVGMAAFAL
jgi:hypothetical protein